MQLETPLWLRNIWEHDLADYEGGILLPNPTFREEKTMYDRLMEIDRPGGDPYVYPTTRKSRAVFLWTGNWTKGGSVGKTVSVELVEYEELGGKVETYGG